MARFNGSDKQIYHNDHLGNVRAITDTSGAIVARVDYYPFGEELGLTGSPGRFTYNGNEFDDEYGFDLYYYGARYMDPALGRFTTPDPVRDFVNPYSYVRNNPMNAIDPTGMLTNGMEYPVINPPTGQRMWTPADWSQELFATIWWHNLPDRKKISILLEIERKLCVYLIENGDDQHKARAERNLATIDYLLATGNFTSVVSTFGAEGNVTVDKNGNPVLHIDPNLLDNPGLYTFGTLYHEISHVTNRREWGEWPDKDSEPKKYYFWQYLTEVTAFMDEIYFYREYMDPNISYPDISLTDDIARSYETNVFEAANHHMSKGAGFSNYYGNLFWYHGYGRLSDDLQNFSYPKQQLIDIGNDLNWWWYR